MEREVALLGHRWPADQQAFICDHVLEGEAVCILFYEPDGDLVFLCGKELDHKFKFKLAHLKHLLEHHPEVASIPSIHSGQWAQRMDECSDWETGELGHDN